jgi:tetratricopeptide (TPR) repeat protein
MALRGRSLVFVLGAVLALLAAAGYWIGWQCWGTYHYRAARAALEDREFRQAADELDATLKAWPVDPAVRLLAAQAARRQGDFDRASRHLRLLANAPEVADAVDWEYRLRRVQNGELEAPQRLLRQAGEHADEPLSPLILEALIEGCLKVLVASGNMGFARTDIAALPELAVARAATEKWLAQGTGHADQVQGLVWRGRLHDFANEHAEAVADLRRAVELAPNAFEPRWHLAMSIGQEAPDETANHLAVLLERDPGNRKLRLMLALGRRGSGRLEDARRMLDELLAANPEDFAVLVERGKLALDAGEPQDAEQWLRRAEAIAPDAPELNLALAHALQLLGRASDAERYQQRFTQLEAARQKLGEEARARVKALRQTMKQE